jgi:hypothetical protein
MFVVLVDDDTVRFEVSHDHWFVVRLLKAVADRVELLLRKSSMVRSVRIETNANEEPTSRSTRS